MVASQAVVTETPEMVVQEMSEHMELLAADGEWAEVENLAIRLRAAVMKVPESERRGLLVTAVRSTERVASEAENARQEVTGRISAIRRGRKATEAYESR